MAGDYSRTSFDALRDYAGVLLQQGHPTLDADWNEFVALIERRLRAGTVDTIGRAVVPRETPNGFEIRAAGNALTIGRGRMYVDGLLAENHGLIGPDNPPAFDRARQIAGRAAGVLDEAISAETGDFVAYDAQPYLPAAPALPTGAGPHLAYLDVWRREVTPAKDPRLLEPALGGIDTATRWQTAWQVRLLADVGAAGCGDAIPAWDALTAPSALRLTNATIQYEDPDEPCLIPPGGGYRGLENQLYRVEIHSGGAQGAAKFKWSRDNASVAATVETIEDGTRLRISSIGRDAVLRFRTGDWVEISDDRREFAGLSGDMRRIEVDEDAGILRLSAALSADLVPAGGSDTTATRNTRVIRWDQQGQVLRADGTAWIDLDAAGSDGLIPVPPAGVAVVLEAGITVSFGFDPAGGAARTMDYWCFAARTATADIEPLAVAPPQGIHHHYARLAIVRFPDTVSDCRIFWPPDVGTGQGHDCGCTVCVTAEEHNAGTRTIQSAIAALPPAGGTVCLATGGYVLGTTPVTIAERSGVRLVGQGIGTVLAYAGPAGAIGVRGSTDVVIEDMAVLALGGGRDGAGAVVTAAAFQFDRCSRVALRRTTALVIDREVKGSRGVALAGYQIGLAIQDNLIVAPTAIGALADREAGYCLLVEAAIGDNMLIGERGVSLAGRVLHIGATRIADNLIFSSVAGITATGLGAPIGAGADSWSAATVAIDRNTISFARAGDGVVSGISDLRLTDNAILATGDARGQRAGSCIRLVAGLLPLPRPDGRIVGNRIGRADGYGLLVEAPQGSLLVKQNVIRDCVTGGVASGADASIATLSLDDNVIERSGTADDGDVAAAIRLANLGDARLIGNAVRGVGRGASKAQYWAGIDLRGAALLDIGHNSFAEIGPDRTNFASFAIRLDGPLLASDISANRLVGLLVPLADDATPWCAIAINGRIDGGGDGFALLAGDAAFPAFIAQGDAVVALGLRGATVVNRTGLAQLRIDSNLVSDARQRSGLPLVFVRTEPARTDACTFSGNQVRLAGIGGAKAIVQIEAPRIVAANNIVHRQGDADAIALTTGQTPTSGRASATILGNITTGAIRINGGNVPPPFDALNLIG